jgi:hypothetical protein
MDRVASDRFRREFAARRPEPFAMSRADRGRPSATMRAAAAPTGMRTSPGMKRPDGTRTRDATGPMIGEAPGRRRRHRRGRDAVRPSAMRPLTHGSTGSAPSSGYGEFGDLIPIPRSRSRPPAGFAGVPVRRPTSSAAPRRRRSAGVQSYRGRSLRGAVAPSTRDWRRPRHYRRGWTDCRPRHRSGRQLTDPCRSRAGPCCVTPRPRRAHSGSRHRLPSGRTGDARYPWRRRGRFPAHWQRRRCGHDRIGQRRNRRHRLFDALRHSGRCSSAWPDRHRYASDYLTMPRVDQPLSSIPFPCFVFNALSSQNAKSVRAIRLPERPSRQVVSGDVLLSHAVARAVPSALRGLASGFGMGPGVSLSLWSPKLY